MDKSERNNRSHKTRKGAGQSGKERGMKEGKGNDRNNLNKILRENEKQSRKERRMEEVETIGEKKRK